MTVNEIRKISGEQGEILSVAFMPDGAHALSAGAKGTIILWDLESGLEIRRFLHGHTLATTVTSSPNGSQMLSGGWDGYIRLWEVNTGRQIQSIKAHNPDFGVSSVAFSPDGRYALSGHDHPMRITQSKVMSAVAVLSESAPLGKKAMDEKMRLWDLQTGRGVRKWAVATFYITSVAYSPDGKYIACSTYSNTRMWEASTNHEVRKWTGAFKGANSASVRSLCFSQDGKLVLTGKGGRENCVCLFEVSNGQQVRQFRGHTARVNSVALSPDGRYALSGGDDRTVILWNTDSGTENCRFTGHTEKVNSVAVSKNTPYAISGSDDGTIRVWSLPSSTYTASYPTQAEPTKYETQPPSSPSTYPCPNCGQPLAYDPGSQRWFCNNCKEYI